MESSPNVVRYQTLQFTLTHFHPEFLRLQAGPSGQRLVVRTLLGFKHLLLLSRFSRVRFVQPHRRQPARLPRPWDSPGKNTGVGRHFLIQCVKVKSGSEGAQSCPTLRNPMDCSPPGSSIRGILQAGTLEGRHRPLPFKDHPRMRGMDIQLSAQCRTQQGGSTAASRWLWLERSFPSSSVVMWSLGKTGKWKAWWKP